VKQTFRPPAVPLVTVDPYFSIWSMTDLLYEGVTKHWTGKHQGMTGLALIDDKVWRFMGGDDIRSDVKGSEAEAMHQIDMEVKPLTTIYTFEAGGVVLKVEFTTPLLLNNLEVLARPASYVTFHAVSCDNLHHHVKIYFDITSEVCVNVPVQEVVWSRKTLEDQSDALLIGTEKQAVLKRKGDDVRIDWGYAYLLIPHGVLAKTVISSVKLRERFVRSRDIDIDDDKEMPRSVEEDMPIMASLMDLGKVSEEPKSLFLVLAYDDIQSVEYFHKPLAGYWRRNGQTMEQMLIAVVKEYSEIKNKCEIFNNQLINDAIQSGGQKYADILSLAYRQSIAAHKLVENENGEALFFSKENFSNGCMGTVDVSYPSIPLFLLYNPELVKGMMRPIFKYALSEEWNYDFAPHDVGRYPIANGQAYGMSMARQMPIEECGNMLIMAAAVCQAEDSADFAAENWGLLTQWVEYLRKNGLEPGNQLCTDDFGGHLAQNVNLSIKAIIGIGGYSMMCEMLGNKKESDMYWETAKNMALEWESMALEDDHYKLAFDVEGTWSLKYNLVWDKIFGLNLFPKKISDSEVAYYISKMNQYGTPLDSRKTYTKADWLVWAATLAEKKDDFIKMVNPMWDFLNESKSRVPLTDWYFTIDGYCVNFVNRSVVGGLFIKLLSDREINSNRR
jgi:hypothetical protein